jgi:tetratricopeptide (TPR) repeat protein
MKFFKSTLLAVSLLSFMPFSGLAAQGDQVQRIMILPFRNLTHQAADNWLGESFSESLLMGLGRLHSLKLVERAELAQVIKEQAFMQSMLADPDNAPQIGKLVGADYMVTGSYQKIAERIQVNVRLVRVDTGEIESSSMTQAQGDLNHLFELQQDLADQLVDKLKVERKSAEIELMKASIASTRSSKAQEYYLKGKGSDDWVIGDKMMQASISNYEKAVAEDPDYALAWAGLSERLAQRAGDATKIFLSQQPNDGTRALAYADKAIQLQPQLALGHRARARVLNVLKREAEALAEARKAVDLDNSGANIVWYLGLKYPNYKNPTTDLLDTLKAEMVKLGADFEDPLILGTLASQYIFKFIADPATDMSPAIQMLEQAYQKRPNYPQTLLLLASFHMLQQELDKVGGYIDKIIKIDPENPILMYTCANLLRFSDKDRAKDLAIKALAIQPNLLYVRFLLMEMYQQQFKDFAAAQAQYRLALAESPENGMVDYTAGIIYFREKRYTEAIALFQTSLEKSRKNQSELDAQYSVFALKFIGDSYNALHQDEEAQQSYKLLLDQNDQNALTNAMTHRALSFIFMRKKDYAQALTHFTQFMQGAPGYAKTENNPTVYRLLYLLAEEQKGAVSAAVLNDIGQGFITLEEYEEAETYLNRAVQIDSQNPVIYYNLGLLYFSKNQLELAQKSFLQAIALKPNYIKALYNLGLIAQQTGQKDQARSYFKRILSYESDNAEALAALKKWSL